MIPETIPAFLDFLLLGSTPDEFQRLSDKYQEWNRRPGGQLEGKPIQGETA